MSFSTSINFLGFAQEPKYSVSKRFMASWLCGQAEVMNNFVKEMTHRINAGFNQAVLPWYGYMGSPSFSEYMCFDYRHPIT